ncbi:glycosyl hydrolase family 98 C-terminal domain-containing protein [Paenibacillus sp. HB172176]|uniref:glycosyl hydrolase family 98 C-terminal domain-containing protein n=1 Tax=Paenibacillus sp. HB172176 TaxID=2493690 RepID=UPI0014389F47|nr:glycosyl hydrolase family 98 C-terminal domain-containing protein [Paenibacillus sp. HB172176]
MIQKGKGLLKGMTICISIMLVLALTCSIAATQNKAHAAGSMRRVIDNTHPMLIMQLLRGFNYTGDSDFRRDINYSWDIKQAWAALPDDIKPYVVFVLHPGHYAAWANQPSLADSRQWVEDNLAEGEDLNIPMMVLYGERPTSGSDGMTWLESLYQTYSNMIGTDISELVSQNSALPGLLALANEYGGYHVHGAMEDNNVFANAMKTQTYYDSIAQYSDNFIPTFKMVHKNYDYVNSEALGLWMAGAAGHWGPYYDSWPYPASNVFGNSSNGGGPRTTRGVPETLYSMHMLDSYLHGATVYQLENQLDIPTVNNLYTPLFYESILPAFRYIISHPIPTKAEVIAKTEVAFDASAGTMTELDDTRTWGGVQNQTSFFKGLYERQPDANSNSGLWYWLRTTGRYGMIPQIPKYAPTSVLAQFPNVMDLTSYNANYTNEATKKAYFDTLYSSVYSGDAFAEKNNNDWLVYNTHYTSNTNESATLPLTGGSYFSQLAFTTLTPHTWAMIDDNGSSMDILLNNYRSDHQQDLYVPSGSRSFEYLDYYNAYSYAMEPNDTTLRETVIEVSATSKPTITIGGYDGHYSYTESWDAVSMTDTITVNHNGPVRLILSSSASDALYWTRTDDLDSSILYAGAWTSGTSTGNYQSSYTSTSQAGDTASYSFFGTAVEWIANIGPSGGAADVYIDGVLDASSLSTNAASASNGQVVYRKSGLTNSYHTITIENKTGTIGIDRFSYIPAKLQLSNSISFNDFSYGSAAADQDTNQGSNHWTIQDGQMKIIPYDSPWTSDVPVYMTKQSYTGDMTYEVKLNSLAGTAARAMFRANPAARTGYSLMLDPLGDNPYNDGSASLKLYKNDSTLLATSNPTLAINQQYDVKIVISGTTIQCYVDGNLYITATDSSYSSGMVGVKVETNYGSASEEAVLVDDASVTQSGTIVYSTDFSSWSAASDWVGEGALAFDDWPERTSFDFPWLWSVSSGSWNVLNDDTKLTGGTNGVYNVTAAASAESFSIAGSPSWSDYSYKTMLKFKSGSLYDAGMLIRVSDADNLYKVGVTTNGTTGTVSLKKKVSGVWTTLASTSRTIPVEKWISFGVEAIGEHFNVSMNGQRILSASDDTFSSGSVGLSAYNGTKVQFDDAWIAQLTSSAVPVTIDDRDALVSYTGAWSAYASTLDYAGTETASRAAGAYAEFSFTGTSISYIGMKQHNMGYVDVYVDGTLAAQNIDCYAASTTKQVVLFSQSSLTYGSHTIRVVVNGTKNASASDYYGAIDAFVYH